jgi:nucleoside phosphorylase
MTISPASRPQARGKAGTGSDFWDVTIGIVTALSVEGAAMSALMGELKTVHVDGDPNVYHVGYLDSVDADRPHRAVLTVMPQDNTRNAAATCTDLIRTFTGIRCVVMLGIAGGIPSPAEPARHVRLGDVIVAVDGIVDYGHVRQAGGVASLRRTVDGISMDLVRAARELELRAYRSDRTTWTRWLAPADGKPTAVFARPPASEDRLYVKGRAVAHPGLGETGHVEGWPKVHYGAIGCADVLLRDERRRDELAARHGILAVEMEGSGIAASAVLHGVHWFMVRGVADYCEDRGKTDRWHAYASMTAAAYLRMMLAACRPFPVMWRVAPGSGVLALLPDLDRDGLFGLLDRAPEVDVRELWRAAMSDLTPLPPPGATTVYQLFDHLSGVNAGPGGLPPALVLVEEFAEMVDYPLASQLRRWIEQLAARLNLTEQLRTYRAARGSREKEPPRGSPAGHPDTTRPAAFPGLLIQVVADGIEPDLCLVNYWLQRRSGTWSPESGGESVKVPLADAETLVEAVVRRAEEEWRDNTEPISIEFLLPTDLLHIAVEWWRTDLGSAAPSPLCLDYQVVVRSLDRMRARFRHRQWIRRWNALWLPPPGHRLYWGRTERPLGDLGEWTARLRDDPAVTSVVLSAPPHDEIGRAELESALSAGVPVILWDRRVPQPDELPSVVGDLTRAGPEQLPESLRSLRANAAKASLVERQAHPGLHLALLWDDPDRLVDGRSTP